jgi:hypothetical protein
MNYVILRNYDHYAIVNDDANFIVGCAYPANGREGLFRVVADVTPTLCEDGEVAVVRSIEEAIPALAAYYENNPPKWQTVGAACYLKYTQFAILRVERGNCGSWLAYRDDHPMLYDKTLADFATGEEAQRAADAHLLDLYPNSKPVYDGLSWFPNPELDWRSCPHLVEARAEWEQVASRWLPDCNAARSSRLKLLQGGKV